MSAEKKHQCIRCDRRIREKLFTDRDLSKVTTMYVDPPRHIGPSCAKKWRALGAKITDYKGEVVK